MPDDSLGNDALSWTTRGASDVGYEEGKRRRHVSGGKWLSCNTGADEVDPMEDDEGPTGSADKGEDSRTTVSDGSEIGRVSERRIPGLPEGLS